MVKASSTELKTAKPRHPSHKDGVTYRTSYCDDAGQLKQRTHEIRLGLLSSISLKQVRKLEDDLNFQRAKNIDPATKRRQRRLVQQRKAASGLSFQKAALTRIKAKSVLRSEGGEGEK